MKLKPGVAEKRDQLKGKAKKIAEWISRPKKRKTKTTTTTKTVIAKEETVLPEDAKLEASEVIIQPAQFPTTDNGKTATEKLIDLLGPAPEHPPSHEQKLEALLKAEPEPSPALTTETKAGPATEPKPEPAPAPSDAPKLEVPKPLVLEGLSVQEQMAADALARRLHPTFLETDLKMASGRPYRPRIRIGKGAVIAEMHYLIGDVPYEVTRLTLKVGRWRIRNTFPINRVVNKIFPETRIDTFNWRNGTFLLDVTKAYKVSREGFHLWFWIPIMEPRDVYAVDPDQVPRHQPIVMGTSGMSSTFSHIIVAQNIPVELATKKETVTQFSWPLIMLLLILAVAAGLGIGMWYGMGHCVCAKDLLPLVPVFSTVRAFLSAMVHG